MQSPQVTDKSSSKASDQKPSIDKLLVILTFTLIAIGIVTVYDASYGPNLQAQKNPATLLIKQARWALIGLGCLLATTVIPYWYWRRYTIPVISIAVIMLGLVLVPHIGHELNGAKRWIGPGSIQLQPSEFAKLALVLYLAHWCSISRNKIRDLKNGLSRPLAVMLLLAFLIEREPDLGTTIVLCSTGLTMMYLAGARRRHLGSLIFAAAIAVTLYSVSKPYRLHRLTAFMDPKAYQLNNGYQVWHGLLALGSAGVPGMGLGDGIEKLNVPMAPTDFIFAVIGEEWGLIGTLTLLGLFLLVAARGYTIAHNTKDPFGSLLAAGLTSLISLQTIINVAVVTSTIPNTGVPLPFISYGGSALLLMMTSIGLLLNISRHPNGKPKNPENDTESTPSERDFERRWERRPYVPRYDRSSPVDIPAPPDSPARAGEFLRPGAVSPSRPKSGKRPHRHTPVGAAPRKTERHDRRW